MEIDFFKYNKDRKIVDKTLGSPLYVIQNAILANDCSMRNPIFVITQGNDNSNPIYRNCNYIFVPYLKRFYYVDDIIYNRGGHTIEIHCSCDVLMTFRESIYDSKQLVERHSSRCNYYLVDNEYNIKSTRSIKVKEFGIDVIVPNNRFVITTSGHKVEVESEG